MLFIISYPNNCVHISAHVKLLHISRQHTYTIIHLSKYLMKKYDQGIYRNNVVLSPLLFTTHLYNLSLILKWSTNRSNSDNANLREFTF